MSDENVTKQMGKLLRQGAALLNKACPKCNTPLLRLTDGTMYCARCDKPVIEQPGTIKQEMEKMVSGDTLSRLASKLLTSLDILCNSLPEQPRPEEIRAFAGMVRDLIEALRGIRDLQS